MTYQSSLGGTPKGKRKESTVEMEDLEKTKKASVEEIGVVIDKPGNDPILDAIDTISPASSKKYKTNKSPEKDGSSSSLHKRSGKKLDAESPESIRKHKQFL
jgi:hypothetical protein